MYTHNTNGTNNSNKKHSLHLDKQFPEATQNHIMHSALNILTFHYPTSFYFFDWDYPPQSQRRSVSNETGFPKNKL
jgi:hypothetical protein